MNRNHPHDPWSRLAAAAQRVTDDRDTAAPYGFSTRVAALAFATERRVSSLFDRFALRAVGVACLLAIASIAINYSELSRPTVADEPVNAEDPLSVLLDA
jgi:hypothetical protein